MGVGGTLHFYIVYNLHHSFFCFRLFYMEKIKQSDYSYTNSNQTTEQMDQTLEEMRQDGTSLKIIGKYLDDPEKYLEVDDLGY